jgi:electron transfer flavoprotein beta subunit
MKVLVGAKKVVDANIKVRVKSDHSDVDIAHSKMSLNPFDENAIEEAVRLKEKGIITEIVALSIGDDKCSDVLRSALARGCDRAILVKTELSLEPLHVAKVFKEIVTTEKPDLIMLGKQATDDDANQVGQMLAGMLNYPQGTFISHLTIMDGKAQVVRELDSGTQTLELTLPAVITADLHLNEPRFIKLPQLMLAKKKPIETILLADMGLQFTPMTVLIKAEDGQKKKHCQMLNSVDDIVTVFKQNKVL